MEATTKTILIGFVLPLLLLNGVAWAAHSQLKPDFLLHANFYDVGQGDAIFIQTYLGNQILIDGGPSNAILQLLGQDMPFFDRTIELVVLTHPHQDHVAGLVDVLERYRVKKVIMPNVLYNSGSYTAFIDLLEQKKIETIYAHSGQRVYLDNATVFDIYYPNKVLGAISEAESDELNDTSIFGKLIFGKTKILLTGDAGENVEKTLLPQFDLDVDVLKVGHHGSRHSTSPDLLTEATPAYAVISVGKNSYGHPTEETLENLKLAKTDVLRTDIDKTIRFVSDGADLYRK
jgi:competence protein ComEC